MISISWHYKERIKFDVPLKILRIIIFFEFKDLKTNFKLFILFIYQLAARDYTYEKKDIKSSSLNYCSLFLLLLFF